jgi:hypothetical protein
MIDIQRMLHKLSLCNKQRLGYDCHGHPGECR